MQFAGFQIFLINEDFLSLFQGQTAEIEQEFYNLTEKPRFDLIESQNCSSLWNCVEIKVFTLWCAVMFSSALVNLLVWTVHQCKFDPENGQHKMDSADWQHKRIYIDKKCSSVLERTWATHNELSKKAETTLHEKWASLECCCWVQWKAYARR